MNLGEKQIKTLTLAIVLICLGLGTACVTTTKWICDDGSKCMSKERATNKCLAQANAGTGDKELVWEQCMRGEGFIPLKCKEGDRDPDCKARHVVRGRY